MVILLGLARRTANNSRKYHYFTDISRLVNGARQPDPLLLTSAQINPTFTDLRHVTGRELLEIVVQRAGEQHLLVQLLWLR